MTIPEELYEQLKCELQRIRERFLLEEKAIEASFAAAIAKAKALDIWEREAVFEDKEKEIAFYKHTLPKFASLIEYYKKRYQAVLFLPSAKKEQVKFFEYEIDKVEKFFLDNAGPYQYLQTGSDDRDREYFLQDNASRTVSIIIGLEKYKHWVQEQLEKLGNK